MPRLCLLLLLLLAACRQEAPLEPPRGSAASEPPHGSAAPAKPRPAGTAPTGLAPPAPIAFQSPEPDCANVQPIRVGGGVERPEFLRRVEPVLQGEMRIKGTGVLELVINDKGRVCTARVLRGLSPVIDRAMVDAVRQWTFRPARLRGKPVAVAYVVTIRFDL